MRNLPTFPMGVRSKPIPISDLLYPNLASRSSPEGDLHKSEVVNEESGPRSGANCIHRGPLIENRKCDTCGNRGQSEPVYQCKLYGECADWQKFRSVRSCRWCDDFVELVSLGNERDSTGF